jgi:hypothetical protein
VDVIHLGGATVRAEADGTVVIRAWKTHGVVHAVWRSLVDGLPAVTTVCRARAGVAWRNTSRLKAGNLSCMSCLVRMSRLVERCV